MMQPVSRGVALIGLFLLGAAILLSPVTVNHAARPERSDSIGEASREDTALLESEGRRLVGVHLPPGYLPPPELSPFGRDLTARVLSGDAVAGKLLTNLGFTDWDRSKDDLLALVPPALRFAPSELSGTGRHGLRPGLNFVGLDRSAIRTTGRDGLLRTIGTHGRIAGFLPGATLLVYVDARDLREFDSLPGIARTRAVEPYNKIALDFGVRPHIDPDEASNPDVLANVAIVPGLDGPEVRARLEAVRGVTEVRPVEDQDGDYLLRVRPTALPELARTDEVLWIGPVYEWVLDNF